MKRFIFGNAYNLLIPDAANGRTTARLPLQVEAAIAKTPAERTALFSRDDVRIPTSVGTDDTWMRDAPLMREHNVAAGPIGRVLSTRVDGTDLHVVAEVTDPDTIAALDAGQLRGLSVSYTRDPDASGPARFRFHELSLCEQPRFEGCAVTVVASREATNKSDMYLGASGGSQVLSELFASLTAPPAPKMSSPAAAPAAAAPSSSTPASVPPPTTAPSSAPATDPQPPQKQQAAAAPPQPETPAAGEANTAATAPPPVANDDMDVDPSTAPTSSSSDLELRRTNERLKQQMELLQNMVRQNQKPNIDAVRSLFKRAIAEEGAEPGAVELPKNLSEIIESYIFSNPNLAQEKEAFVRLAHYENRLRGQITELEGAKKAGAADLRKAHAEVKRLTEENTKLQARLETGATGQPAVFGDVFGGAPARMAAGRSAKRSRNEYERGIDPFAQSLLVKNAADQPASSPSPSSSSSSSGLPQDMQTFLNQHGMLAELQGFPSEPLTHIKLPGAKY
jgi:hypothetical protein